MRHRWISTCIGLVGLALAAGAHAQAADHPDAETAMAERMADDLDKERLKLTQDVAAGKLTALTPLAAKLEYGDERNAPDLAGALDLYQKAADAGSAVGAGRMCIAYLLGEGRPQDTAKGLAYCDKLTDGSPTALFGRGYATHEGVGVTADTAAADALFAKAVDGGSGPAADLLGRDALAADKPEEARIWFRRGVFRGSVDALDDMARMAEAGEGGPQEMAEAYWLYIHAARRGNAHAAGWVVDHADIPSLPFLTLKAGNKVTSVTETYTDAKGQAMTRSVDVDRIQQDLQNYFPRRALAAHLGGFALIDCYVNAANQIDACWLRREDPPGYEFGRVVETLYEGRLTLAPIDVAGQPTAQHVFSFAMRWNTPW